VDVEKRDATRRNHTATHLMHAALREVLGTHVKQAGSVVAPNYLRFDFSHFQPLSRDEITEIERLVNYHILRNEQVGTEELALEEAMQTGAMALFGEKYAEKVRVLSVPGAEGVFSKELCGGTHAVREVAGIRVLAREASELDAAGLRQLSDTLLARVKSGVVVLGRQGDGKASIIVRTSKDLHGRVPAGQVIRELAPIIGGRGGGKPDMAEGGGAQVEKLAEALEASYEVVGRLLEANAV
jgi:alanyl-tRNA synthetase